MRGKMKQSERLAMYKDKIDFVYSLTHGNDYNDGFGIYKDTTLRRVVKVLVDRNVLKKKKVRRSGVKAPCFIYRWNETAMAPTALFYKTIMDEVSKKERAAAEMRKPKKADLAPEIVSDAVITEFEQKGFWYLVEYSEEQKQFHFNAIYPGGRTERPMRSNKYYPICVVKEGTELFDTALDLTEKVAGKSFKDVNMAYRAAIPVSHFCADFRKLYDSNEPKPVNAQKEEMAESAVSLTDFTAQQLWDELKRRGAVIKDGRLQLRVTTYLNLA